MDVQIFKKKSFKKKNVCATAAAGIGYKCLLRIIAQCRKHCESFADLQGTATGAIKQAY